MHWGCYYATALDIEVDPQCCCLGSCQSDFALQAVVECRALETERVRLGSTSGVCVLLLQDLLQSCARGGRRRVEDMRYERRRAEACVDESAHHALVNAGGREIV